MWDYGFWSAGRPSLSGLRFLRRLCLMKFRALTLALILGAATIGTARAEVVITTRYPLKATHVNGSSERAQATYIGSVDVNKWAQATRSTAIKPTDELWCHWKIQSRITRLISFDDKNPVDGSTVRVPPTDVGILVTTYGLANQDCESSASRFQSDYIEAVSGLTGKFDKVVNGDTLDIQNAIRGNVPDVSHVELEY
jgi:hypothetical protein